MADAEGHDPIEDNRPIAELERIGVRELRQHASRWLQRVSNGESFEITDNGRPVARLTPLPADESRMAQLIASGKVHPPTAPLRLPEPVQLGDGSPASEVLAQMRAEERY